MGKKSSGNLSARTVFPKGIRLLTKPNPGEVMWLNFAVTYLCNCRCAMCNIWKKYSGNPALLTEELTLQEIEKLLDSKYLRNLQGISFTGGEPFLRKDLVEVVGLFIQRYPNAFVSITTNGLIHETIAQKTIDIMKRYDPKSLHVSLSIDGTRQKHDEVRGVTGSYSNLMQTVTLLQSQTQVNLGFDFTVTPQNYLELPQVSEISEKLGVALSVGFAHNSQSYYGNRNMSFVWKIEELKEAGLFIEKIVRNRIKNQPLLVKLFDPYVYIMENSVNYESNKRRMFRCYSGTHSFFLDPQGDVYPCIISSEKLGNIKGNKFDELWLSAKANQISTKIGANSCHCWVDCEVAPSLIRSLKIVKWNMIHKFLPDFR